MTTLSVNITLAGQVPVLSGLSADSTGATTWAGAVNTDVAEGTLFYIVTQNASESVATIKSGSSQAVSQTGPQNLSGSGLTQSTTYYLHVVHSALGEDSDAVSTSFVTEALAAGEGTVAVSIQKRSKVQVAPEAVYFQASVSGANETENLTAGQPDPTFYKVVYVWDFGDPGAASDKVVNLPSAQNDLNKAYGKNTAHVFTGPGTYTVTCTAYNENDGTLIGSGTQSVTVKNPATEFAGSRTILYDPSGTGDSENFPSANVVTTWSAAMTALGALGQTGRVGIKRGTTTQVRNQGVVGSNFYLFAWGTGARPVLETNSTSDQLFTPMGTSIDVVISGIACTADWNTTTEAGSWQAGSNMMMRIFDPPNNAYTLVTDTTASGFGYTIVSQTTGIATTAALTIHNSDFTNWGDYGAYMSANTEGFFAVLGTTMAHDQQAMMGGAGGKGTSSNQHGPIRTIHQRYAVIDGNDFFSRSGWTQVAGRPAIQPCLRLQVGPVNDNGRYVVTRNAMETGDASVVTRHATNGTRRPMHLLVEKNLMVGGIHTERWGDFETPAVMRNNICVKHNGDYYWGRPREAALFARLAGDWTATGWELGAYSNTLVNYLNDANRDGWDLFGISGASFSGTIDANNALFAPNATGQQPFDPLLTSVRMPTVGGQWASRFLGVKHNGYTGLVDGAVTTMNTAWALPSDLVRDYKPGASSPLLGAATGRVALDDFFGAMRDATATSRDAGAVERT